MKKPCWRRACDKSDLSEHLNGMGLSDSTKGAVVTLLDTGLNKKYLVEACAGICRRTGLGAIKPWNKSPTKTRCWRIRD